jgi:hypothetical protein
MTHGVWRKRRCHGCAGWWTWRGVGRACAGCGGSQGAGRARVAEGPARREACRPGPVRAVALFNGAPGCWPHSRPRRGPKTRGGQLSH